MKKSIFLVMMMAFSMSSFSQQSKAELNKLYFAFLAGITSSTVSGESDSYTSQLIGYQAGVMMNYDIGQPDHYVFTAETNIGSCGAKYKDVDISGKVVLTYINIPLVMQYRDKAGFYGEAGVQPSFLVSAKDKYNGGSYDYKDAVKSFDFGIPLGIGYIIMKKVGINLRYNLGLANINKGDPAKDHNRVWAFRLFWVINS